VVEAIGRVAVWGIIEELQGAFVAAVDDVIEKAPVAPCQIDRFEQVEVRGVLHVSGSVAWSMGQVYHLAVGWSGRIDREPYTAGESFIWADVSKTRPGGKRFPGVNVPADLGGHAGGSLSFSLSC
jgi:hypothetical protein